MACCQNSPYTTHIKKIIRGAKYKSCTCPGISNRIECAILSGHLECAISLIQKKSSNKQIAREHILSAVESSIYRRDSKSLEFILEHALEFDVNATPPQLHKGNHKALKMWAIKYGTIEIIDLLVKHGANFDQRDRHSILERPIECIFPLRIENYKRIISICAATIQTEDRTCKRIIRAWLEFSDITFESKNCFLDLMIQYGGLDIQKYAKYLVKSCILASDIRMLQKLVSIGIDVATIRFKHERTLFHVLVQRGQSTMASDFTMMLVSLGLDINGRNDTGYTPLHYAASRCNWRCCVALLEHGARVDIETINGAKPIDLFCQERQISMNDIMSKMHKEKYKVAALLLGGGACTKSAS